MLENLKKKGFKFDKPENSDIYERVRISSKEFNESINAWRPENKMSLKKVVKKNLKEVKEVKRTRLTESKDS